MNKELLHIIQRCVEKDRVAQKQIFELMAAKLLSVSRQYCPNGTDPKDNLQDSFIKLFARIKTYDPTKGSFDAWARKIVINTALDKLNKKTIEEVVLNYEELEIADVDEVNGSDNVDHLMDIIEKLPDGYKQVFCLFEIEGYSHKEIAAQLQIKEASSRSQLNRSKQLLKQMVLKMDMTPLLKIQPE